MAQTITYEIKGSFPPFGVELSLNGNVIASQAHDEEGVYSFRNITASGNFIVTVYDTKNGKKSALKNLTTTPAPTTPAPTTPPPTTPAPPPTTPAPPPPTTPTPIDPCTTFGFTSVKFNVITQKLVVSTFGVSGEEYTIGVYLRGTTDTAVFSPATESITTGGVLKEYNFSNEPNGTYVVKLTGKSARILSCAVKEKEKTVFVPYAIPAFKNITPSMGSVNDGDLFSFDIYVKSSDFYPIKYKLYFFETTVDSIKVGLGTTNFTVVSPNTKDNDFDLGGVPFEVGTLANISEVDSFSGTFRNTLFDGSSRTLNIGLYVDVHNNNVYEKINSLLYSVVAESAGDGSLKTTRDTIIIE